jgi:hypothetical protein
MESKIYGIIDNNNCLIDTSKTLNGYNKIGYRIGYNAFISHEKINNKWEIYK